MVAKLQIFLVFLKLSSNMGSLWINLLTPTWLFGSAGIGCFIYTFFNSILKLALYLFQKKNKDESRIALLVQAYVLACTFLLSEVAGIVCLIILSGVVNFDVNNEELMVPSHPTWIACLATGGGTTLVTLIVFILVHRGAR